jgi:hypothetical protein
MSCLDGEDPRPGNSAREIQQVGDVMTKKISLSSLADPIHLSSTDLLSALKVSFPSPHFAVLNEVRDSTGHDSERAADALALGMYRSRGRELWGFEFKVSRSDWLCELRQPEKAESWFQFCDRWALVVSDVSIVSQDELPVGWGLCTPRNGRLKWIVKCPLLTPASLSRHGLAALVYRAAQQEHRDANKAYDDGLAAGKEHAKDDIEQLRDTLSKLRESVNQFEREAGISISHINSWGQEYAAKLGKAVKAIMGPKPSVFEIAEDLRRYAGRMEHEADRLRERALEISQEIAPPTAANTADTSDDAPKEKAQNVEDAFSMQ